MALSSRSHHSLGDVTGNKRRHDVWPPIHLPSPNPSGLLLPFACPSPSITAAPGARHHIPQGAPPEPLARPFLSPSRGPRICGQTGWFALGLLLWEASRDQPCSTPMHSPGGR